MARSAHDFIGDAERVHDIERGERDVRRLENVAAGVKNEIRPLARFDSRTGFKPLVHFLAEARQFIGRQLHARKHVGAVRHQPEIFHARLAALARLTRVPRHLDARHRQQKARVDAVVARRDAIAGQHAAFRPGLRGCGPLARAHDIEHAGDHIVRQSSAHAGGIRHRANLDALAALRAGVEHFADAYRQGGFEGGLGHRNIQFNLTPTI